jgi:hypothetical protein
MKRKSYLGGHAVLTQSSRNFMRQMEVDGVKARQRAAKRWKADLDAHKELAKALDPKEARELAAKNQLEFDRRRPTPDDYRLEREEFYATQRRNRVKKSPRRSEPDPRRNPGQILTINSASPTIIQLSPAIQDH